VELEPRLSPFGEEPVLKILVVDDDFFSRTLLGELLQHYGTTHFAANGKEALDAVRASIKTGDLYQLICLDIIMPELDGQSVLKQIRNLELEAGISLDKPCKIIMTTALKDGTTILGAFRENCDGYLVKPFDENQLRTLLTDFRMIDDTGIQPSSDPV
jgi:two-component system, chemotaxis family, chemotaxis protein CheY